MNRRHALKLFAVSPFALAPGSRLLAEEAKNVKSTPYPFDRIELCGEQLLTPNHRRTRAKEVQIPYDDIDWTFKDGFWSMSVDFISNIHFRFTHARMYKDGVMIRVWFTDFVRCVDPDDTLQVSCTLQNSVDFFWRKETTQDFNHAMQHVDEALRVPLHF